MRLFSLIIPLPKFVCIIGKLFIYTNWVHSRPSSGLCKHLPQCSLGLWYKYRRKIVQLQNLYGRGVVFTHGWQTEWRLHTVLCPLMQYEYIYKMDIGYPWANNSINMMVGEGGRERVNNYTTLSSWTVAWWLLFADLLCIHIAPLILISVPWLERHLHFRHVGVINRTV